MGIHSGQKKTFHDTNNSGMTIQTVTASKDGLEVTSIELFYPAEHNDAILRALNEAGVQVQSLVASSLKINADGRMNCAPIILALNALKTAHLISDSLAEQIVNYFPLAQFNHLGALNQTSNPSESRARFQAAVEAQFPTSRSMSSASRDRFFNSFDDINTAASLESQLNPFIREFLSVAEERFNPSTASTPALNERFAALWAHHLSLFKPAFKLPQEQPQTNAQKLDDIGFSRENLESEQEKNLYDTYVCSIDLSIMTNPVHDSRAPQYQFEESNILRWLKIKQEHPYTRQPLTSDRLSPSLNLKQEIEAFVDEKTLNHQNLKK